MRRLPLLLGFLQAVGAISTDMYLPAFPAIDASLHAPVGSAQFTLASWLLGICFGQLIQGAISDRFGRRAPLLLGTALYTAASVGCALSGSIAALACWRFIAALGGSASMIVPRAIVRDLSEGHAAARMMAQLTLILGAAPILAPSLGGLVLLVANWRGIFWITTSYGLLAILLTAAFLPDTQRREHRMALSPAALLSRYRFILGDRGFMTNALILGFTAFALFAYLGGMPIMFILQYHYPPYAFAIVFGAVAGSYIFASQLNMALVRAVGLHRALSLATSAYLVMVGIVLAVALADHRSVTVGPIGFALALALAQAVTGFIIPTATVGALHAHASHAGSASAMLGTLQFLVGACGGLLTGLLTDGTSLPTASLMLGGAAAVKIADLCRPNPAAAPAGASVAWRTDGRA
jgi:DHA1 family bicyclomycin/chloramphenicol resistance-like MFS transporter